MNYRVPDFEMDEDCSIPTSSGLYRQKNMPEEEIMELLWQNGQVVVQSQNHRSLRKSPPPNPLQPPLLPPSPVNDSTTQIFMQEDEMAAWLHYPLDDTAFDRDLYADLICPLPKPPSSAPIRAAAASEARLSPPSQQQEVAQRPPGPQTRNFPHFSRVKPAVLKNEVRESTVVDSNEAPVVRPASRVLHMGRSGVEISDGDLRSDGISGAAAAGKLTFAGGGRSTSKELETCDFTVTSSPSASGASATAARTEQVTMPAGEDRKRKGRERDEPAADSHSEDADIESAEAWKQPRGLTTAKRSRAAEVHNLSERRRRDRINEKMRALQELIPRCSKSDKASMLDEAIEYLKSLQTQVQMMSMGCSVMPMMFPSAQQYMPPLGMGMAMGMGMEMGMRRPMMPFPPVLPVSALPTPAGAPHLVPRFPLPAFLMPRVPSPDPSRIQASNQACPIPNSLDLQRSNFPWPAPMANPYQQYLNFLQMQQLQLPQNQPPSGTSTSKPGTSKVDKENEKNPCG
ncbi:hypothetical protein Nepgr_004356 [Nepenthes gracilis]|uniref:BHLH domain-containing protein n=1 Tax=Nepenthes gracilis TaxID=150966 RepID=A0AAD3XF31_NEPGR|nr:hypothetical protein Nepgr_004356 [Nepenthes gracilis]